MKLNFCALVTGSLFSLTAVATTTDLNMTATIINTSCQIAFSNGGQINLGTVTLNDLERNTDVNQLYSGGAPFSITVNNCVQSSGKTPSHLTVDFLPVSGALSPANQQVFINQQSSGAQNVGVVILSTQDAQNIFNVLDAQGHSQSIYPVSAGELSNATYRFHARMQKVDPAQAAGSGVVKTSVFVSAYYD